MMSPMAVAPQARPTHGAHAARQLMRIASGQDFPIAAAQLFGNVRLDFPVGQDDHRQLVSMPLGDCRLSYLQAGVHTVYGDRVAVRSSDPDSIKLIIQSDGHSLIEQSGTVNPVRGNVPVLYDPTRSYRLVNTTPVKLLMLQLPRTRFSQPMLQRLATPLLPGDNGLGSVLLSMMRSAMVDLDGVSAATRASVGSAMLELARGMFEDRLLFNTQPRSLELLLRRAKEFIASNLASTDLTVAMIARRMGCSPRYVFRAFELEARTPADYLWSLRLEKACDNLQSADGKTRSISDIALSNGFTSTSHFSRAFRQRYGMTPRDWRYRG